MQNLIRMLTAMVMLVGSSFIVAQEDSDMAVVQLQTRWAEINYQMKGKEQKTAFAQLVSEAELQTQKHESSAPVWIWSGIIKSTYAGAKGGLGALKYAKAAKADLERAMEIDAEALSGSAYTSLGTLYFNVPGWPIGFGSDDKAEELLLKALELNPDGIDPNYFYAEFLRGEKQHAKARSYYEKALQAAPRPGRETADKGRREEINNALAKLK